jgi:hypothetical protein
MMIFHASADVPGIDATGRGVAAIGDASSRQRWRYS